MSIRQQLGQLLWQHGVENDAVLDALDWKFRKIMDEIDRLRAELKGLQRAHDQLADQFAGVSAENNRLRGALEQIAEANWLDDPQEARRIARAALAKEAGQ